MVLLVPIFFVACFTLTLLAARRQSGGLTRGGAVAAAYLSGLATMPAVVLAWVASVYEIPAHELVIAGASLLVVFAMGFRMVKQPFEHAVPMDNPGLEAAIAQVASRAGLTRTPRLLRLRTLGAMPVYGWVAVLHDPVVILADGLVHRLEPDEHAAILAHEIAHIRTGSLWWLQLSLPVAATISMAMLVWVDMWVALGSTWALWVFLARVISRPTERLCDRRAAALTSPAAMISGLRKMHAVHPVRDPGWRWTVAWALATHPPATLRIHDLGEDQGPIARRLRRTSAVAFTLWLAAYLAVLSTWSLLPWLDSFAIGIGLALLGLGLQLAPRLAARTSLRRRKRMVPPGLPGRTLARAGWWLFVLGTASILADLLGWWTGLMMLGALVCLGLASFRGRGLRSLRQRVHKELQGHHFGVAHQIGMDHPRHLVRDPGLRHDVALASLAAGHRLDGIDALEAVVERAPKLLVAALTLGKVKLEDDPARSLAMGLRLSQALPDDAPGPIIECMAQRRLGHHHEAMAAWARARALIPDDPGVLVLAIELAIDAGSLHEADRWVVQAEERTPGGLDLLLAQARLALARGDPDTALVHLERARAVLADHPLAFLDWRLAELEQHLASEDTGLWDMPECD
jgi:Zn-dependent protease with chaperone function